MDDIPSAPGICKKLVEIPSVSDEEKAIADFIESWGKAQGLDTQRIENSVVFLPAAASAASCAPPWTSRAAVILYAHIDTVPAGDATGWTHAPLSAHSDEFNLYGLGASDDKGAAACLMETALKLKNRKTASDVYFLFASGEEKGGSGAKAFLQWWAGSGKGKRYARTWAIIGEPTDLKNIELGARGAFFIRFDLRGKSYHGADLKRKKDDALSKAFLAGKAIEKLQKEAQLQFTDPVLGKPSISLTGIAAGERANKLPDVARLTIDVRTTPGFHEKAAERIAQAMRAIDPEVRLEVSGRQTAPYIQSAGTPLAQQVKTITGAKMGVSRGSNDASFFLPAGIPAVCYGPGVKACIHQQNEYIPLKHFQKGTKMYVKLAQALDPMMQDEMAGHQTE